MTNEKSTFVEETLDEGWLSLPFLAKFECVGLTLDCNSWDAHKYIILDCQAHRVMCQLFLSLGRGILAPQYLQKNKSLQSTLQEEKYVYRGCHGLLIILK